MYRFISVFILSLFLMLASKSFAIDNILSQDVVRNYVENSGFENGFYPHSFNPKSSGVISNQARSGFKSALFTSIVPTGTEATIIIPSLPQGENFDVYFYYKTSSATINVKIKDSLSVPVHTFILGACPSAYCKSAIKSVLGGQSFSIVIDGVGSILIDDVRVEKSGGVGAINGVAPIVVTSVSGGVEISIPMANTASSGYISSTDWTTFNGKQNSHSVPSNYVLKSSGAGVISQSSIFDFGNKVSIGTTTASGTLDIFAEEGVTGIPHIMLSGNVYEGAGIARNSGGDGGWLYLWGGHNATSGSGIYLNGNNVADGGSVQMTLGKTTSSYDFFDSTISVLNMRIQNNGNVGIGTGYGDTLTDKLRVNGSTTITGTVTLSSLGSGYVVSDGSGKLSIGSGPSGSVQGSGTVNKVAKWSGTATLTDSSISDDGATVEMINVDIKTTAGKYFYLGDPAVDGCLRYSNSAGALLIEKRIAGVWTELMTIDEN